MFVIAKAKLNLITDLGMRFISVESKRKQRYGLYRCMCGVEFESPVYYIKSGNTKSCGCLKSQPISERLAAHSIKVGDCLIWTANTLGSGYGQTSINHAPVLAHRSAYEEHHGKIPDGMHELHKCDVRACINPDHLFLGTHAENMADMVKKGRSIKGEQVGTSKLTEPEVILIFNSSIPVKELAKIFSVSLNAIYKIKRSETWLHITEVA